MSTYDYRNLIILYANVIDFRYLIRYHIMSRLFLKRTVGKYTIIHKYIMYVYRGYVDLDIENVSFIFGGSSKFTQLKDFYQTRSHTRCFSQ